MITIEQIDYKISHSDNLSRTGKIICKNKKEIETPLNWMGLSVGESAEFQFKAFKKAGVTCFLSNVYDLKSFD